MIVPSRPTHNFAVTMSQSSSQKGKNRRQGEGQSLLFISQDTAQFRRSNLRAIVSHARKTQTQQKHTRQRESAQQNATYARSLVGWQQEVSVNVRHRSNVEPKQETGDIDETRDPAPTKKKIDYDEATIKFQIDLPVRGGLRSDPFSSFPMDNLKEAMEMIDFYVQVYSFHKTALFDEVITHNTIMDVCWPYVLRDDLTFDATLALTRTVWLYSHNIPIDQDALALHYKGRALVKLSQRVKSGVVPVNEAVIFTVARLVTLAYLTSDDPAFQIHLDAFEQLVTDYPKTKAPGDDQARMLSARLDGYVRSWRRLQTYRSGVMRLDASGPAWGATFSHIAAFRDGLDDDLDLPEGLQQLEREELISDEVLAVSHALNVVVRNLESQRSSLPVEEALTPICQCLRHLTRASHTSSLEVQFCCGLRVFCVFLAGLTGSSLDADVDDAQQSTDSMVHVLDQAADIFIYNKSSNSATDTSQIACLKWAALIVGCGCFLPLPGVTPSLRGKGHIILFTLYETLLVANPDGRPRFASPRRSQTEIFNDLLLKGAARFWLPKLLIPALWRICKETTDRQYEWEQKGLFNMGVPRGDRVEFMVLRFFRGALPAIPVVEF